MAHRNERSILIYIRSTWQDEASIGNQEETCRCYFEKNGFQETKRGIVEYNEIA